MKPKVDLISAPLESLRTIYTACRTCYSDELPIDIYENTFIDDPCVGCESEIDERLDCIDDCSYLEEMELKEEQQKEKMLKLVRKVIASGHHSTIEHCQFTFAVSKITRKTSHQIVRHRIGNSYSQKSQRYVTYHNSFTYNVPASVNPDKKYNALYLGDTLVQLSFHDLMGIIQKMYASMNSEGINAEDCRDILPNACHTDIVWSLNLRSLIHLANLRLCVNAQSEIREVVKQMCDLVIEREPWMAEFLTCKGVVSGTCNEINKCQKGIKLNAR